MTRAGRLALGALAGALLTLLLHPASRPFVLGSLAQAGPSRTLASTPLIPNNLSVLPVPRNQLDAGLWMQVGAELALQGPLDRADLESLQEVAGIAAEREPDNAFWLQMEAVFADLAGDQDAALKAWQRGALAIRWDSYQTRRLSAIANVLERESGRPMAWHFGRAYMLRSEAAGQLIVNFGRNLISRSSGADPQALTVRTWTVANGRLMRDGARSIRTGRRGVQLVEFGMFGVPITTRVSPRREIESRLSLVSQLQELGLSQASREVEEANQTNEAWEALADRIDPLESIGVLSVRAVAASAVPSGLFVVSLLGALVWLVGRWLERVPEEARLFRAPFPQVVGLGLGLTVFAVTGLALLSITLVLCFAFLEFGSNVPRPNRNAEYGPAFRLTLTLLATLFGTAVVAFVVGTSTPAVEILPQLDWPRDLYGGRFLPLGLSILALTLLLLTGPGWGVARRVPTVTVLGVTLREFGALCFWGGLALMVVGVPLAMWVDSQTAIPLRMLMGNEPNYYLLNTR